MTAGRIPDFAELDFELGEDWRLRLGGRVDYTESDARDADAPSLQMRSVRENYVFYYGPDAARVDRSRTLGSGNLRIVWEATEGLSAYLGSGLTSRTANVTELYFAFALNKPWDFASNAVMVQVVP